MKKTLRTLINNFGESIHQKGTVSIQVPTEEKPQAADIFHVEGEPEDGPGVSMHLGEMYAYGEPEDVPERCRRLVELYRKGGPDTPEYVEEVCRIMGCSSQPDDELEL